VTGGDPADRTEWPISRRAVLLASAALPVALNFSAAALAEEGDDPIDWRTFLAQHDLVWQRLPRQWGEAPFLGNGRLALSVIAPEGSNLLRFAIDNVDVFDRRDASWGWPAYARARYHPGDFHLQPVGCITGCDLRLDLWRAELRGEITTDRGTIAIRARVQADAPFIAITIAPSAGEAGAQWHWHPGTAISSRPPVRTPEDQADYRRLYGHPVRIWRDNPAGARHDRDGVAYWLQALLAGGGYTTAWAERRTSGGERTLFVANAMSWPELDSPDHAVEAVHGALAADPKRTDARHQCWWADHYRASFVTLPDTRLESFYWIQIYKYGCVARPDAGVIDTHGPWLQPSNWPYLTWNLNVQLSYYALQPSNRLALAEGLFHTIDNHRDQLRANARPVARGAAALGHCSQQALVAPLDMDQRYAREWGNLLWVCHLYWLQYRFTMDRRMLRERILPLMREAVALYLPALEERSDGRLHLAPTYSPETAVTADCNYDLALLKWATSVLAAADGGPAPSGSASWSDIAERLAPFPTDVHGYRIGADVPAEAHRHFSHLMMIWPLYLENIDRPSMRPLLERSVDHWLSLARDAGQASGFTLACGASFEAALGRGDAALDHLQALLGGKNGIGRSFPNTMYAESGQNIETPLAAAQAIHDMLLQSWGDTIRVFPAVPTSWADCGFRDLRAEGAFLVSAERRHGALQWLRVTSLAGAPCITAAEWTARPRCDRPDIVRRLDGERCALALRAGETATLHLPGAGSVGAITPLRAQPGAINSYGLPGGKAG
jgi:alpha-L-fucosidase 2